MDKYFKIGHLWNDDERDEGCTSSWTNSYFYKTYEEALAGAQKQATKDSRDIQILEVIHVVRYPVPTYPVEAVT